MELQGGAPDRAASDADRQLAVVALRDAAAAGVLTLDELDQRLSSALKARRLSDLVALTWGLMPAPSPPPARRISIWRRVGFGYHATAYALTNALLVGTWAMTGHGYFWPFFPMMGWGVGLGIHAAVAANGSDAPPQPRPAAYGPPHAVGYRAPQELSSVRYVAVMFADVANSTKLNEAIGDQAWNKVRLRHLEMVRNCMAHHDGVEVSTQGDGFFARFDTPADAVGCAMEIQKRAEAQREEAGFAPEMRIGIHAGEAIEDEDDLVGSVINLASRVTAEAEPGQILVTEPVADRSGGRFAFDDCGLRTLKGISTPRHLLAVRW